jgi:hypothetical protein
MAAITRIPAADGVAGVCDDRENNDGVFTGCSSPAWIAGDLQVDLRMSTRIGDKTMMFFDDYGSMAVLNAFLTTYSSGKCGIMLDDGVVNTSSYPYLRDLFPLIEPPPPGFWDASCKSILDPFPNRGILESCLKHSRCLRISFLTGRCSRVEISIQDRLLCS